MAKNIKNNPQETLIDLYKEISGSIGIESDEKIFQELMKSGIDKKEIVKFLFNQLRETERDLLQLNRSMK